MVGFGPRLGPLNLNLASRCYIGVSLAWLGVVMARNIGLLKLATAH